MDKEEARERLEKSFYRVDHGPSCSEKDIRFVDEEAENYPNHDGCLVVKCWNCHTQDHFLYENE